MDTTDQKRNAYEAVFTTEMGQAVLRDLAASYYAYEPTVSRDPIEMAFFEGQRSVVLAIMSMLRKRVDRQDDVGVDPMQLVVQSDDTLGDFRSG